MIDVGRVCIKIAGRDAGKIAVVVEKMSDTLVLVDGNVRRKKCNIKHLEPTNKVLSINKGASTEEVHEAMKASNLKVEEKKKVIEPKKSTKEKE